MGPDGERLTWAAMSTTQRKAHMQTVILPLAADVFQNWRPEHYTQSDGPLCHGDGTFWEAYHMPTVHLPKLSDAVLLSPEFAKHPNTTRL